MAPVPQKSAPPLPPPVQLPLFPEEASLVRIRPEKHEWRYYRLAVWADLSAARCWSATGAEPAKVPPAAAGGMLVEGVRHRRPDPPRDPHPDAGAACNALARLLRAKRQRGYRDRGA